MTRDALQVLGVSLTDDQKLAVFPVVDRELVESLNPFVTKRDREWQRLHRIRRDTLPAPTSTAAES